MLRELLLIQCIACMCAWRFLPSLRYSARIPSLLRVTNTAKSSSTYSSVSANTYAKQLSLVQKAHHTNDKYELTKRIKDMAATFRENVQISHLLPILMNMTTNGCIDSTNVCDILWSVGRMNLKSSNANNFEKRSVSMKLVGYFLSAEGLAPLEFSKGFVGMAGLNMEYSKLPFDTRAKMQTLISGRINTDMDEQGVSNIVYSLGKMGVQWKGLQLETQQSILKRCTTVLPVMPARSISTTVYGLGMMNVDHNMLSRNLQSIISNAAAASIGNMTIRGVANTIYGLGRIKAKWRRLSQDGRSNITECLVRSVPLMPVQGLVCVMHGLAQMEAHWLKLPIVLTDALQGAMQQVLPAGNDQHVSNIVHSLGKMDARFAHLNGTTHDALLLSVGRCLQTTSPQGLSSTLHGLAAMCVPWALIPDSTKAHIDQALIRSLPAMATQEVASIVYSLSKLAKEEVSPRAVEALVSASNRHAGDMRSQELSNTVYGFGKMKVRWDRVSTSSNTVSVSAVAEATEPRNNLSLALSEHARSLTEQGLSNVLYGLALSGMRWHELTVTLQQALEQSLMGSRSRASAHGMSTTLYSLHRLGCSWTVLSLSRRMHLLRELTSLLPQMNEPSIANALYSLAVLDASWAEFPLDLKMALVQAIKRTSTQMVSQEVANVMYALAVLSFDEETTPSFDAVADDTNNNDPIFVSRMLLWYLCSKMVEAHSLLSAQTMALKHRTQFDVFFQLMNSSANGARLVETVAGAVPDYSHSKRWTVEKGKEVTEPPFAPPDVALGRAQSGVQVEEQCEVGVGELPSGAVEGKEMSIPQSLLHRRVVTELMNILHTCNSAERTSSIVDGRSGADQGYKCLEEFSGLSLAFPVDAAIFRGSQLGALLEVDGDSHYTVIGHGEKVLHRVDRLKERLYAIKYPDVPFHRVSADEVNARGLEVVCRELAAKITASIR